VLIYLIGVIVTALLSNDATAVVLTPAVYAACRTAKVKDPLPYLYICAFIANAASFVLPISNPANLVIFAGGEMPPLSRWLGTFFGPAIVAVVVTFIALYWSQRRVLAEDSVEDRVERPALAWPAKLAGAGLLATAAVLVSASAFHIDLGLPTFLAGIITCVLVLAISKQSPVEIVRDVSWGVIPLVAGLFVIVEAVGHTGITATVAEHLKALSHHSKSQAIGIGGVAVALFSNLVNNLPAGLFSASIVQTAQVPDRVAAAVLIGVDLGPNLSFTGSLATILWLSALRREGIGVSGFEFLKLGAVVMTPALLCSLLILSL
jgi:arsenical pump membrane protein